MLLNTRYFTRVDHSNRAAKNQSWTGHNHKSITTPWDMGPCQGISQELEVGCLKLAIVKFLGVQIFKGDHNILQIQP